PANYGLLIQRREFIEFVVNVAHQRGALVIFDEVISGFRVALGGMAEVLGMRPDLVTYGKVIGGGFPVAAYGGRRDLMELVAPVGPVYQAGTLSANPVGMRAGLATLQKIESSRAYAVLEERTARFCDRMNDDFRKRSLPFEVTRAASIFWLHTTSDAAIRRIEQIPANNSEAFAGVFHGALDRGVYLAPSGYEVNFISLAHSQDLLERAQAVIVEAATGAGLPL
ncbi:MAG TPA: aminotransferase class III-fold pyridoxal phosphate-dependent enzyme, partial [Chthoniobacterales bacterium]